MRNLSIQGLRGIAAIIVFFSHTLLFLNIPQILPIKNSFFHIFFDGQISVMVFIAMSGFFYMKSDSFSFYSYFSVVKKKTIRIFVPYVIAMTFGAILCNSRIDFCMNNFSSWANSFWKTNITLLEYFNGDRESAIIAKSNVYSDEFINWFGDWGRFKTMDTKNNLFTPTGEVNWNYFE